MLRSSYKSNSEKMDVCFKKTNNEAELIIIDQIMRREEMNEYNEKYLIALVNKITQNLGEENLNSTATICMKENIFVIFWIIFLTNVIVS